MVRNGRALSVTDPALARDGTLTPHLGLEKMRNLETLTPLARCAAAMLVCAIGACSDNRARTPLGPAEPALDVADATVDARLTRVIQEAGFTGRVGQTLPSRLGHAVDPRLANLGRLLFFDDEVLRRLNAIPECRERFGAIYPHIRSDAAISYNEFGPGANEDFGLAQITGNDADRYAFRSSPLRNIGLQQTFMHNGAFTRLQDAIGHHLNAYYSATTYSPAAAGVALDLQGPMGPIQPVLNRLDPKLRTPIVLSAEQLGDLVQFVRTGLLDPRTSTLPSLIPVRLPSGRPVHTFQ